MLHILISMQKNWSLAVTHSSALLLTSIIISFYPPETRGSCKDKRTSAPWFSRSFPLPFYWSRARQLTDSQRDKEACYFLYSRSLCETVQIKPFLYPSLVRAKRNTKALFRWLLNISKGKTCMLAAYCFTEEDASTLTRDKRSYFS